MFDLLVLKEMKIFFLQMWRMGYQKIHFIILISKCEFDFSKKCTQKNFSPENSVFWAKLFWGALFTKVKCTVNF
jgi:hypothetical protein